MSNISGIGISFSFGLGWGDDDNRSSQNQASGSRVQDNGYDASRYFYYEKLTKKERKAIRKAERETEEAAKAAAVKPEDKLSESPESNDGRFVHTSAKGVPRTPSPEPPLRPKGFFKPHPSPEETRF